MNGASVLSKVRGRLHANRYCAIAAGVVMLCAVVEWMADPPAETGAIVMAVAYLVSTMLLPMAPSLAVAAQFVLFAVQSFLPYADGPTQQLGVLLAMAMLAYRGPAWLAVAVALLESLTLTIGSWSGTDGGLMDLRTVLSFLMTFLLSILMGCMIRERQRFNALKTAEHDRLRLRRNIIIASRLHDAMSARLARLIFMEQVMHATVGGENRHSDGEPGSGGAAEWAEAERLTREILNGLHSVMDGLESSGGSDDDYGISLMSAMDEALREYAKDLRRQGCRVRVATHGVCPARLADAGADPIMLLGEVCGNLAKYGRTDRDEARITVEYVQDAMVIHETNRIARSNRYHAIRSGYGLRLQRSMLRDAGGRLVAGRHGDAWSVTAVIPVTVHPDSQQNDGGLW